MVPRGCRERDDGQVRRWGSAAVGGRAQGATDASRLVGDQATGGQPALPEPGARRRVVAELLLAGVLVQRVEELDVMFLSVSEQLVHEHVADLQRLAARRRQLAPRRDRAEARRRASGWLRLPSLHRAPSAIGCRA